MPADVAGAPSGGAAEEPSAAAPEGAALLTPLESQVIGALPDSEGESLSVPEIAAELLLEPAAVRQTVESLGRKDLVHAQGSEILLTRRGQHVHRRRVLVRKKAALGGLNFAPPTAGSETLEQSDEKLQQIIDSL